MPPLSDVLRVLQTGKMVVVDDDREHRAYLMLPAQFASSEALRCMTTHCRGPVSLALRDTLVDRHGLPPTSGDKWPTYASHWMQTIAVTGHDQARAIRLAVEAYGLPGDILSSGDVVPSRAADGGVLARNGCVEAAVDLVVLAGLQPAAMICEIARDDEQKTGRTHEAFARAHEIPGVSLQDIAIHRIRTESLVEERAVAALPSSFFKNALQLHAFRNRIDGLEHLAAVKPGNAGVPLVRLHSECLTGDALGSLRCDCGDQLRTALELISESASGALLYLRGHEGRGIGLGNKIRAYALQDQGFDTVSANEALGYPADARDYWVGAQMLKALGFSQIRLLSNNPNKAEALERCGIRVEQLIPLIVPPNPFNRHYLSTKRDRLRHVL